MSRALMSLAATLARDGHGAIAQDLRDAIDDARRLRWLLDADAHTAALAVAADQSAWRPLAVRERIDEQIIAERERATPTTPETNERLTP